jgi:hypothetical protein
MAFYADSQTLCEVMTELFRRVMANPTARRQVRRTKLVVRLVMSDPDFVLSVDGKSSPPGFTCNVSGASPDLVLHMKADVLHNIWLSEIRLRDAYWSGQIKVEGSLLSALALSNLFRHVEALYPSVLQDKGLLPHSRRYGEAP